MSGDGLDSGGRGSDLLRGAVAGAVAVWVMDRLDWLSFEHLDPAARRRTERVRPGGLDPAHRLANGVAEAAGFTLRPRQPHPAGIAVHYGFGIGPAVLYAAHRDKLKAMGPARGAVLGLGLFLVQDEAINYLSGLSASPTAYPWQAHARGLLAHVVMGLAVDAALNAMGAALDRRKG